MNKTFSLWFHKLNLSEIIKLKMYNSIPDFEELFKLEDEAYCQFNLNTIQVDKIKASKRGFEQIQREMEMINNQGIHFIDRNDALYPIGLKEILDPPMALFVRGRVECLAQPMIAIVGARKCSEYGFEMARKLAKDLASKGIVVVSGMALGIDEAAHRGALKKGQTIAVLGTGVNKCYPKQNYEIYREIPYKGCLVSEYLPNVEAMPFQFPKRNRIISGMSEGTVLVEAAKRSGSLITADLALEQNKTVFAVPGNICSSLSEGTNNLIQQGAKLVIDTEDIIDELPIYIKEKIDLNKEKELKQKSNPLDKVERMVYDCLSWQPKEINELITNTNLSGVTINTILLKLEIKGLIQRLPGNRYVRLN